MVSLKLRSQSEDAIKSPPYFVGVRRLTVSNELCRRLLALRQTTMGNATMSAANHDEKTLAMGPDKAHCDVRFAQRFERGGIVFKQGLALPAS